MDKDILKVLITEDEIKKTCKRLASEITASYNGKHFIALGILKGCLPFMMDLLREFDQSVEMYFMRIKSFSGVSSTGKLTLAQDIDIDVKGKNILIVEDIVDSGRTLTFLKEHLIKLGATVKVVTLLDKKSGRIYPFECDFKGFDIPDEFVVGYGFDYYENYRNLRYIGVLKKECLKEV